MPYKNIRLQNTLSLRDRDFTLLQHQYDEWMTRLYVMDRGVIWGGE